MVQASFRALQIARVERDRTWQPSRASTVGPIVPLGRRYRLRPQYRARSRRRNGRCRNFFSVSVFWAGLIAYGVIHLIFFGEPRSAIRHHGWIYVSGIIMAICLTAIIATTVYGYFEMRVRQGISDRPLNITARRLDDPTKSCIKREAPTVTELENKLISVAAINGDREGMQYAGDFIEVFAGIGLLNEQTHPKDGEGTRFALPLNSNDPTLHGILLGVPHKDNPPGRALLLQAALLRCAIATRIVGAGDSSDNQTLIVIDQPP
jgi:hypothetical protein